MERVDQYLADDTNYAKIRTLVKGVIIDTAADYHRYAFNKYLFVGYNITTCVNAHVYRYASVFIDLHTLAFVTIH